MSDSWREFFADYRPAGAPTATVTAVPTADRVPAGAVAATTSPSTSTAPSGGASAGGGHSPAAAVTRNGAGSPAVAGGAAETREGPEPAIPLRGAAGRIVANMEASLGVPTATSVRVVPAKLLEVNRTIVNNQLFRTTGGKVSFTHLIGYAVVKALMAVPAMNAAFVADADGKGTPGVVRHRHVGLGLAVDVEKSGGGPHPPGAVHHRRRHPGLPGLRGRLRGAGAQDPHQQDRRPTTSPAPR